MYDMWTRGSLKSRAKQALKGNYWKAFLVSLIIGIVNGAGGSSSNTLETNNKYPDGGNIDGSLMSNGIINEGAIKWFIAFLVIIAIVVVVRLIVGYSLEVGGRKFFVRASEGESNLGYLAYGFKNKRYTKILKTMFVRDLYLFLWTLLFIIPGIIKSYSYRMVPYILADNPNIGTSRAIELSNQMTKGEKANIFVLDLSFIGWYILGIFALFIGILFVLPYQNATDAELYLSLKENSIRRGLTDNQELNNSEVYTPVY